MNLNEKVAKWCGFVQLPEGKKNYHFECTIKVMDWQYPDGYIYPYLPNFIESMDAILKWVVPKLKEKGLDIQINYDQDRFDKDRITVGLWIKLHPIKVVGDTVPMAFCKALEKYINETSEVK